MCEVPLSSHKTKQEFLYICLSTKYQLVIDSIPHNIAGPSLGLGFRVCVNGVCGALNVGVSENRGQYKMPTLARGILTMRTPKWEFPKIGDANIVP